MAVKKPESRKTIGLPDELWETVIDVQHEERWPSQAETVRRIMVEGIKALRKKRQEKQALGG